MGPLWELESKSSHCPRRHVPTRTGCVMNLLTPFLHVFKNELTINESYQIPTLVLSILEPRISYTVQLSMFQPRSAMLKNCCNIIAANLQGGVILTLTGCHKSEVQHISRGGRRRALYRGSARNETSGPRLAIPPILTAF